MPRRSALAGSLLLVLTACTRHHAEPEPVAAKVPQRIVSLAPSVTETLYALGLGERVVGVTRFCDYPPEAATRTRVGGFMDPNYEAIVGLRPDLCVLTVTHSDLPAKLRELRLRTLEVPAETVADIREAIRRLGAACGAQTKAADLLADLDRRTAAVTEAVGGRPRPRVLICIGRDASAKELSGLYIAGPGTFYDELIKTAGGVNACPAGKATYPQMSAEGVISVNPEVIIDLGSQMENGVDPSERMVHQWDGLTTVAAVRQHRVHAVIGTHALRPSPRYIQFLEQLARIIQPDSFKAGGPRG